MYNFLLDKNDNMVGNQVESDDDIGTVCIQNEGNEVVEMECAQKEEEDYYVRQNPSFKFHLFLCMHNFCHYRRSSYLEGTLL